MEKYCLGTFWQKLITRELIPGRIPAGNKIKINNALNALLTQISLFFIIKYCLLKVFVIKTSSF